ncbi:uncharacterized protein LOC128261172 isoform X2 [Drosophila gunungcola]|nr:uncharacterized protein LOC128261172 isoform X2 [Drosophila gunungcola]
MAPRTRTEEPLDGRRTRGIKSYRCRVCKGVHPLRKCSRFLKLSAEKRLRAVLVNKYCSNCLAHDHSKADCRSGKCKKCQRNHHTLLHMHERSNSGQRSRRQNPPNRPTPTSRQRSASPTPAPSLSSLLQRHSVNVLPTASVMVKTGSKTFETAALIDPCTPVSCIDASRAAAFRLPTTSVGDDKVCNATIQSKCGTTKMEVVFKVEPKVGIRTPTRTLNDAVRTKFKGIQLADERFYLPATISVILGADVYPKVIQSGFLMVDEGLPVAQKTVFGWIISGACHQP